MLDDVLHLEDEISKASPDLGQGHPPEKLALLFRLLLTRLLRQDAESGDSIRRLLELAEASAAKGLVPAALPGEIRGTLAGCARSLRDAGAWATEAKLWWEPLPEPGAMERRWAELEKGALRLPRRDEDGVAARQGAVGGELLARIYGELEGDDVAGGCPAGERAGLGLEAEGVGGDGRRSRHRSDEVRYLSGFEPTLLAERPWLALFIQFCLSRVAPELAGHPALTDRLGGMPPAAPQTAMLARYEGPSGGYSRHLDNPGGEDDNGRALSLVLYLNPADHRPAGGELEVWAPGSPPDGAPRVPVPPCGGNAVLADARRVPHRVRPLRPGPARWTLVLWFRDDLPASPGPALRSPTPAELLAGIDEPPLPPGRLLLREVSGPPEEPRPTLTALPRGCDGSVRSGVVTTTYGAGPALERWCRHHLDEGIDHLLVVLDRPDEPAERELADHLRRTFPGERLTLWNGPREAAARWPGLGVDDDELLAAAASAGAARDASTAVAARQTFHASAALAAARGDELGGAPLDWLAHLDDDEFLSSRGPGRGGSGLAAHFAALDRSDLAVARYLVHELLHPWDGAAPPRFKLNPAAAALRLGPAGWSRLRSELGAGPYFIAHTNGKAATRVASATAAAGVHGWRVAEDAATSRTALLDGPALLHFPVATAAAFERKLARRVSGNTAREGTRLFPPSHAEDEAIRRLDGQEDDQRGEVLGSLYRELAFFSESEIQILTAAGLLLTPDLPHGPPVQADL